MLNIRVGALTWGGHTVVGEGKVRGGVNVFSDNGSLGLHVSVAALLKSNVAPSHFTHTGDYLNKHCAQLQPHCIFVFVTASNTYCMFILYITSKRQLHKNTSRNCEGSLLSVEGPRTNVSV